MPLPIACTLTPEQLKDRRSGLLPGLLAKADGHLPIEGGWRFRFTPQPGTLAAIAQVIDAERQCCQFLRFDLTVEPGGAPFWLQVTGPAGTREFLQDLLNG